MFLERAVNECTIQDLSIHLELELPIECGPVFWIGIPVEASEGRTPGIGLDLQEVVPRVGIHQVSKEIRF